MLLNNEEVQEELREEAQKKEFKYKRAMAWYCNKKFNLQTFTLKDLALRNAHLNNLEWEKGKLVSKWEDPYVIQEEIRPGMY